MRLYYFLFASAGRLTDEIKTVAGAKGKTPEFVLAGIASGRIVIPCSPYRYARPVGIGKGCAPRSMLPSAPAATSLTLRWRWKRHAWLRQTETIVL